MAKTRHIIIDEINNPLGLPLEGLSAEIWVGEDDRIRIFGQLPGSAKFVDRTIRVGDWVAFQRMGSCLNLARLRSVSDTVLKVDSDRGPDWEEMDLFSFAGLNWAPVSLN